MPTDRTALLAVYQRIDAEMAELIGPTVPRGDAGPRLERIGRILALLGDPQRALTSIHVGGTSGKGSTATMISSILTAAGYRTALHLSPHLQVLNERFQIGDRMASTTRLAAVWDQEVRPAIARVAAESPWGPPSYFEAQVALAFALFAREKVDVAVVEVGLGGSLDATNVLAPRVTVITSIGLDHTEILGDTVEAIARDKAGIIKPGQTVVSGVAVPSARSIIAERCAQVGSRLWQVGAEVACMVNDGPVFSVRLPGRVYRGLSLSMLGDFQCANAACAVAAAHAFTGGLPVATVRSGLMRARVPGRMEVVQEHPTVVLDGAHNEDKMRAASEAMERHFGGRRRVVVLALKHDKAYNDILPHALAGADLAIVTVFGAKGPRGPIEAEALAGAARIAFPLLRVRVEPDPLAAVRAAMAAAGPDGVVWVTGSLYLVGAVRTLWQDPEALILAAE